MKKLPKIITKEEFEKLLKEAPKVKRVSAKNKREYILAMILGGEAGLRISEIVGLENRVPVLTKDKIDLQAHTIRIESGKGKKDRIVCVPPRFRENHLRMLPLKVQRRALQHFITKLGKEVLEKEISFHTLRHYFGSQCAERMPLHEVQMLLGHSRLDSVPDYTPIMIRSNGEINILSLEDLWNSQFQNPFKICGREGKTILENVFVFNNKNDKGFYWSRINEISRHIYNGSLIKINSSGGLIDVSPNHSIMCRNQKIRDANNLRIGNKLSMPQEEVISWKWGLRDSKNYLYIGTLDLVWLYGFFTAEGSAGNGEITIYNFNKQRLLKCKQICENNFHKKVFLTEGKNPRISICDRRLVNFFKDNFYTSQNLKRIPKFILNANKKIKKAFLDGYNEGDGYIKGKEGFTSFCSNSQVLMAGLLYLIKCTTNQDYNLFIRKDKEDIVQTDFCDKGKKKTNHYQIKKLNKRTYEGWLYDLSTENETFCAGVGNIRVHNTTGIYLHANPKQAVEAARKVFEE